MIDREICLENDTLTPKCIYWAENDIFHSKMAIFHWEMAIFHWKMAIFHWKMAIFHFEMAIFHSKMAIFHWEMTIFHSKMAIFHWEMAIFTRKWQFLFKNEDVYSIMTLFAQNGHYDLWIKDINNKISLKTGPLETSETDKFLIVRFCLVRNFGNREPSWPVRILTTF